MTANITPANTFGTSNFIVSPNPWQGNYTTIASAVAAATAGDTIFICAGTYTENVNLKAGVNLASYGSEGISGQVTITGTFTFNAAGEVAFSGIQLSSDPVNGAIRVIGTAASVIDFIECDFQSDTIPVIVFTTTSANAQMNFYQCTFDITTGGSLYAATSPGSMSFTNCTTVNSGGTITNSTANSTQISLYRSTIDIPLSTLGGATIAAFYCLFTNTSATPQINLQTAGANFFTNCSFSNGAQVCVAVADAGAIATMNNCVINSTNVNKLSGIGTIKYNLLSSANTSDALPTSSTVTEQIVNIGTLHADSGTFNSPLPTSSGGTGTTLIPPPANGSLLIGNSVNFTNTTLTQGTGITITNGSGSITIDATAGALSVGNQIFSTSGTYTPTANMGFCYVECIGGGGGGGAGDITGAGATSAGSGGGAGEYRAGWFDSATIGVSQAFTIGANGSGAAPGGGSTDGTATAFGALISASGGAGGQTGATSVTAYFKSPNLGGSGGSGGTIVQNGAQGSIGISLGTGGTTGIGGAGASSIFGAGGIGGSNADGADGTGFGSGGGGGGCNLINVAGQNGGDGATGYLVVTEYIFT